MLNKIKKKVRRYISPFFLVRFTLYRDLCKMLETINISGKTLDVGCGNKPFLSLFKNCDYIGIDFNNFSQNNDFEQHNPDVFFQPSYQKNYLLPFINSQFDNCVSFQVLEHHPEPQIFIREIKRVTKRNGFIILSVPFLGGIHEEPNDYQRYTKYGLIRLFENNGLKILKIKEEGSLFSTISLLFNEYLNDFACKNKFCYFLSLIIYPPFLIFSYLSLILDRVWRSNKIFFNYLVLAKVK